MQDFADFLDCSQSPIFPFDRRDRAQTFKKRARTGESDITTEWVGGVEGFWQEK